MIKISSLKANPDNPRIIKDEKFKSLVKSITEFPEMMEKRPLVCVTDLDGKIYPLGGNMRLKAIKEAGKKEIPNEWVMMADDWSEEKRKEFVIKDNVSFGEWDYDSLAESWDIESLNDWGFDELPFDVKEEEAFYSSNIKAPIYEPKNEKPIESQLYNEDKVIELIKKIESSGINEEEKKFLIKAAYRHTVFNYQSIADFYAHSNKDVQELMEQSALVIIDFKKAIENGYVHMSEKLLESYKSENND